MPLACACVPAPVCVYLMVLYAKRKDFGVKTRTSGEKYERVKMKLKKMNSWDQRAALHMSVCVCGCCAGALSLL